MRQPEPRTYRSSAKQALESAITASLAAYDRHAILARLHRLSSETIRSQTVNAAKQVVEEIERAMRRERARSGHWTYDLNHHIALHVAHRAETARLAGLRARDASARAFQSRPLCIKSPESNFATRGD